MQIAEVPEPTIGCQAFVAACESLGFARNRDNNGEWFEGVAPNQLNVHKGRRWSPAVGYLRPAMKRPNLRVETERLALRLTFAGTRCTGVVVRKADGTEETWTARREVLLSAGAIESPKLLMLSGIGDGSALQAMGIESRVHAPEVGRNLQDHFMVRFAFRTKPADTLNESMARSAEDREDGARLGAAPARPHDDRRLGGQPVCPRAAGIRGSRGAVPVRRISAWTRRTRGSRRASWRSTPASPSTSASAGRTAAASFRCAARTSPTSRASRPTT
ncbi:GMC family oxidoreductase [Dankookia sp. P2]|uniref:GMC family oxidoreductase n=1 Tax=Dankookia sp. P2 TaxID=3423955 RepID=UPI003D6720F8